MIWYWSVLLNPDFCIYFQKKKLLPCEDTKRAAGINFFSTHTKLLSQDEAPDALTDSELASGFKQYVPGSQSNGGGDTAQAAASALETNKLVKFRGSVLDLEKLMEKMDK